MEEREIVKRLLEVSKTLGLIKKADMGACLKSQVFREALGWYGLEAPELIAEPDLILVFEDYKRLIDDVMIIAVELKCFQAKGELKQLKKDLRKAFREIGQPLRYLPLGFDSAVLWHIFEDIGHEELIRQYVRLIGDDTIERLNLPIVYFATTALSNDALRLYWPLDIKCDIGYAIRYLKNLCDGKRNPVLDDNVVKKRRKALKVSLGIP